MPLKLGGSNWPENLQLLCRTCNLRKNAKHPDVWRSLRSASL
jgi:5-methylcytosine-specific restriction endonuclease McrA